LSFFRRSALSAREQARRYRHLFECAPDGYLATDWRGTIEEANLSAAALLHLQPRDLVDRPLGSFVCGEQRHIFATRLERLTREGPPRKEEWLLRLSPAGGAAFDAALAVAAVPPPSRGTPNLLWSVRDISRRRRVERRLVESQKRYRSLYDDISRSRDELRVLSARYLNAREEEAKRIGRELHDEAGQIGAAVYLALAEIGRDLLPHGRERLREIGSLIQGIEDRLRRLSHELRPTILDDLGLLPAIEFLAAGFSRRTGVLVRVRGSTGGRLDSLLETALYRIVQEALSNIAKHARATYAEVEVSRRPRRVVCAIRDDGIGFRGESAARGRRRGLGLLGVRERLDALSGKLLLMSRPGGGTELLASVPLRRS
jgi:PAS domain S-box-containing protein